jgi:hypothetical protein
MSEYALADNPLKFKATSRVDLLPGSITNALCRSCKQVFSNTRNWDAHRFAVTGERPNKCLDPSTQGMVVSAKGLWITEQEWFNDKS